MAGVPCEDSDQLGNLPSLIQAFAVGMEVAYTLSSQGRLISPIELRTAEVLAIPSAIGLDCMDVQADPSLLVVHMPVLLLLCCGSCVVKCNKCQVFSLNEEMWLT